MGLELPLILGTSSVFRREQMERLGIAFQAASPDFDETPMLGNPPLRRHCALPRVRRGR